MKRSIVLCAALLVSAIAGCDNSTAPVDSHSQGGKSPQVLSNCVSGFTDITSCPIGAAALQQTSDGISVSGMGSAADGVASNFENATRWERSAYVHWPSDNSGHLLFSAMSDGEPVSTLSITQTATPGELELFPSFTDGSNGASQYVAIIYSQGAYQGGRPIGLSETVRAILHEWDLIWWAMTQFSWRSIPDDPTLGACVWNMKVGGAITIEFSDGTAITGDEVEFVEYIDSGSHPYTSFQGIKVQGQVDGYDILEESIVE